MPICSEGEIAKRDFLCARVSRDDLRRYEIRKEVSFHLNWLTPLNLDAIFTLTDQAMCALHADHIFRPSIFAIMRKILLVGSDSFNFFLLRGISPMA